jgi:hypothetical protein
MNTITKTQTTYFLVTLCIQDGEHEYYANRPSPLSNGNLKNYNYEQSV